MGRGFVAMFEHKNDDRERAREMQTQQAVHAKKKRNKHNGAWGCSAPRKGPAKRGGPHSLLLSLLLRSFPSFLPAPPLDCRAGFCSSHAAYAFSCGLRL